MTKKLILVFTLVVLVGMADAQQNSSVVSGDQPTAVKGSADNSGAQTPESDDIRRAATVAIPVADAILT
jgi:hypothetical protein